MGNDNVYIVAKNKLMLVGFSCICPVINNGFFHNIVNWQKSADPLGYHLACLASVFAGFGSIERLRNGIFGILSAWEMGREPKKERWVLPLPLPPLPFTHFIYRPLLYGKVVLREIWAFWLVLSWSRFCPTDCFHGNGHKLQRCHSRQSDMPITLKIMHTHDLY